MKFIVKIIYVLKYLKWRYLFSGSIVLVEKGCILLVGKNVSIKRSRIKLLSGSRLNIDELTEIKHSSIMLNNNSIAEVGRKNIFNDFSISVQAGSCLIGNYNIFCKAIDGFQPRISMNGYLRINDYNRIACVIWIRFGGEVGIGSRNAINQRTEIRADNSVSIGNYNQISYDCVIWDTNTHNIYKSEKRRNLTDKQYPAFGVETEPPITKHVCIGDDCWIARRVSILKGVCLANKCIVAYNTTLVNGNYAKNSTIYSDIQVKVKQNTI